MIKEIEEFSVTKKTTYDTHKESKKKLQTHMRPTHSKSPITLKHILLQYENYSITNDIYIQPNIKMKWYKYYKLNGWWYWDNYSAQTKIMNFKIKTNKQKNNKVAKIASRNFCTRVSQLYRDKNQQNTWEKRNGNARVNMNSNSKWYD